MSEMPANYPPQDPPPPSSAPGYGPPQPGPGYGQPVNYGQGINPAAKSKVVVGLLGIFLGAFGVHRFYLGYTKIGAIQLGLTIITCGFASLWGFVEGILYLVGTSGYTHDADGVALRD